LPEKVSNSSYPEDMLINLCILFLFLFGTGWAFGRWLLPLPVLMALFPFVWHLNLQVQTYRATHLSDQAFWVYMVLVCGLGILLLLVGMAWEHSYPLSLYLFPLLSFVVYMAPWQYFVRNSSLSLEPFFTPLLFFSIVASLAILSYLLPMYLKLTPISPSLDGR
jgi:hypothetical protein